MARQLPEERVSENTPEGMVPNDATVEGVGENIIQAEDVGSGTPGQAAATEELGKPATEETVAEQSSKPSAAGGDQGKDENQSIEEALNILDEAAKEGDAEAVDGGLHVQFARGAHPVGQQLRKSQAHQLAHGAPFPPPIAPAGPGRAGALYAPDAHAHVHRARNQRGQRRSAYPQAQ